MVEPSISPAKELEHLSFMQRVRRHKQLYGYFGVESAIGVFAYFAGIAAGSYLNTNNMKNYITGFGSSGVSTMLRVGLELTVEPYLLYKVNKDLYRNGKKSRLKEFGIRYFEYMIFNNTLELLVGGAVLNYWLDHPFGLPAVDDNVILWGKATAGAITIPINFLFYQMRVLKSNPLPGIGRKILQASDLAGDSMIKAIDCIGPYRC